MAVGANRWPPVWLVRLSLIPSASRVPAERRRTSRAVPSDPQHRSRRPCPQTRTSVTSTGRAPGVGSPQRSDIATEVGSEPPGASRPVKHPSSLRQVCRLTHRSPPPCGTTACRRTPASFADAATAARAGISAASRGHGRGHSTRRKPLYDPAVPIGSTLPARVIVEHRRSARSLAELAITLPAPTGTAVLLTLPRELRDLGGAFRAQCWTVGRPAAPASMAAIGRRRLESSSN